MADYVIFAGVNGAGKSTLYNKGYVIHLYYIGLESPDISKERIRNRVLKGGHDIPSDVIDKRYIETFENLKKLLPLVDYARIYDNTEKYKLCYGKFSNSYIKICERNPKWLEKILKDMEIEKQ